MINWTMEKELLAGYNPARLKDALDELVKTEGWQFIESAIAEKVEKMESKVLHTIESTSNGRGSVSSKEQKVDNHNRNVVTIKTLECVLGLPQDAKVKCDEELKKGR